ncbi:Hsp70 family protein [uncultured Corynebacterium sp.]|uniref:Hsp70 family protein n=1 Tax=uncultured Corynebacterium sp. TaxID=159447 RepID=UPI0025E9B7B6|nr:Hsp70 family protein [uncultured Corynebacterium sp.]
MTWNLAIDNGAESLFTAIRDAETGKTDVDSSPGSHHATAIRRAIERGSATRDGAPSRILFAHPAAATDDELRGIADAVDAEFRDALSFVPEPVAAAHHCLTVAPGTLDDRAVIVDAGARGFRVSVVIRTGSTYVVDAHRRRDRLGGHALDARVREWVNAKLAADYPSQLDWLGGEPSARAELADEITAAKKRLSELESTHVEVPGPYGPMPLLLTRADFHALIVDDLDAMVAEIFGVMGDAATSHATPVHLVGGGAHVPALRERLERAVDVHVPDRPDAAVARGALAAVGTRTPARPAPPEPAPPPPQPAVGDSHSDEEMLAIAERVAKDERRKRRERRRDRRIVAGVVGFAAAIIVIPLIWSQSVDSDDSDDGDRSNGYSADSRTGAEETTDDPRERARIDEQERVRSTLEAADLPAGSPLDPAACEDDDDSPELKCDVPGIDVPVTVAEARPFSASTDGHTVLSPRDPRAVVENAGGGERLVILTTDGLKLTASIFPDVASATAAYETLGFTVE